jgi:predicted Fe-Mo cluster-binding NifX family protein
MKVAVPEYQGRVAPVFDSCKHLLVFRLSDDGWKELYSEDWSMVKRESRPGRLRQLGVETLVCGGISCRLEALISQTGIRVIPWLAGEIGEIVTAVRDGTTGDPCHAMPGRRGCRRRYRMRNPDVNRGAG